MSDEPIDAMLQMKQIHIKKVKALMKANDELKKELNQARKEGRDNYRVKMIKSMKLQIADLEGQLGRVKVLAEDRGASLDDIINACENAKNAPKRVRPVSMEKLKKEINSLKKRNIELERKLKQKVSKSRDTLVDNHAMEMLQQQIEDLNAERDGLKLAIADRDIVITEQKKLVETQEQVNSQLIGLKWQLDEAERNLADTRLENTRVNKEFSRVVSQNEEFYQEIRSLQRLIKLQNMNQEQTEEEQRLASNQEVSRLKRANMILNGKKEELENSLKDIKDEMKMIKANIETSDVVTNLKAKIRDKEQQLLKLNATYRQQIDELKNGTSNTTTNKSDLELIGNLQYENEQLKDELKKSQLTISQLKSKLTTFRPTATPNKVTRDTTNTSSAGKLTTIKSTATSNPTPARNRYASHNDSNNIKRAALFPKPLNKKSNLEKVSMVNEKPTPTFTVHEVNTTNNNNNDNTNNNDDDFEI